MSKRPTNQRKSPQNDRETAGISAADSADHTSDGDQADDFDLLDGFDPDSDASCWDPGEIDREEPEFVESDFCLEDEADDD